jgi:hypothetical protein
MEDGGLNMKSVYILLVLVVAASALGCVGKKAPESTHVSPAQTPVSPETTVSPGATPTPAVDEFGTDADITAIDSLVNDSSMDISLSEVTI